MPKGKKSKRCGRGKLPDGKGGCRKMTYAELQYLGDKAVAGAIAVAVSSRSSSRRSSSSCSL